MKKKLIAALLSAAMVVSAVPVFASDAAADEETREQYRISGSGQEDSIYHVHVISNYLPDVVGFIYRNSRETWYGSKHILLQR